MNRAAVVSGEQIIQKERPAGLLLANSADQVRSIAPGVLLAGLVASAAITLGKLTTLQSNGIGALTLAIVLGMEVGNTRNPRIVGVSHAGVTFSK